MEKLKVGDVVKVKSGGPKMAIQEIGEYSEVQNPGALCKWFIGDEVKQDVFALDALELAK